MERFSEKNDSRVLLIWLVDWISDYSLIDKRLDFTDWLANNQLWNRQCMKAELVQNIALRKIVSRIKAASDGVIRGSICHEPATLKVDLWKCYGFSCKAGLSLKPVPRSLPHYPNLAFINWKYSCLIQHYHFLHLSWTLAFLFAVLVIR